MTLPLTDSGLIGTALAASALGIIVLTAPARGPQEEPVTAAAISEAPETVAAPETVDVTVAEADAEADGAEVSYTPEFAAQVRAYLLDNPAVIFEAVSEFERQTAATEADMDRDLIEVNSEALFHSPHDWVGGNPEGDITLVEFLDYRCVYCRRAHPELEALLAADDDIRFVIKEFPILGPDSETASRFAIAVLQLEGPEAYKAAHDALIELEGAPDAFALEEIAESLGADFDAIEAHMSSDAVSEVLTENRLLAQRLRISGTPTFVMETEMVRGFVPADRLLALAEELRP
ncbi:MAG: DsbA family protein [Rhodobacteraceae bacterium]|nr:DsbA family protein [Paracoccaceae bacterium]